MIGFPRTDLVGRYTSDIELVHDFGKRRSAKHTTPACKEKYIVVFVCFPFALCACAIKCDAPVAIVRGLNDIMRCAV